MTVSKEALLRRKAELEEELKEREDVRDKQLRAVGKRNIYAYTPHPKQLEFHSSNARIRFALGANSSGKTLCGCAEAIFWFTKSHPYKPWVNSVVGPTHGIVVVVSRDQQKLPGGPQSKLLQYMPDDAIAKKRSGQPNIVYAKDEAIGVIHGKDGSTITFITSKAKRDTYQGVRANWIWIDEECIPTPKKWNELITRVPAGDDYKQDEKLAGRLYLWMTATPNLEGTTWMQTALYEKANKPDSEYRLWQMSLQDNTFMTDAAKNSMMEDITEADEVEYNARVHGAWQIRKGLIYDKFNRGVHVIPPLTETCLDTAKEVWRIIDPHESKPIAVLWVAGMPDGRAIIFEELNEQGIVSQVAEWIKRRSISYEHKIVENIIDYSGNKRARTDGKSISQEFRANGIACKNCVKTVTKGINAIKRMLFFDDTRAPTLYVTANCRQTVEEFSLYSWKPDNSGQPKKEKDEMMDNIRYWACSPKSRAYVNASLNFAMDKRPGTIIINEVQAAANAARKARRKQLNTGLGSGVGR